MMEELSSSETSVLTRAKRRNVPEDDTPHSQQRKNLKSYTMITPFPTKGRIKISDSLVRILEQTRTCGREGGGIGPGGGWRRVVPRRIPHVCLCRGKKIQHEFDMEMHLATG
jgi:hypothetical protein